MGDAGIGELPGGGRYLRVQRERKGYTVEPTSWIECKFKEVK